MQWSKFYPWRRKHRELPRHCVITNSPLDLTEEVRSTYVVDIDVQRCRTNLLGYSLIDSPFVKTLVSYAQKKETSYKESSLEHFYTQVKPQNMAEVLHLKNSKMEKISAMATVMPWWKFTPDQILLKRAVDTQKQPLLGKEATQFGLPEEGNYGWQYFGPVSPEVGDLEYQRLTDTYNSISSKGYKTKKSVQIHGEFLVSDNDWVWVGLGGKHRTAALAALGWEKIPVTTDGRYGPHFVKKEEFEIWPNVANGIFSPSEALQIFDTMMKVHSESNFR